MKNTFISTTSNIHPSVKETVEIFEDYSSVQSLWNEQAADDREFYDGNQWTAKAVKILKSMGHFPITDNVIKPTIDQMTSLLTSNKPRFSTTGREDSDTTTGVFMASMLSYIWDISYGNVQLKKAIEDRTVEGVGVCLAYYNPEADFGKGEIMFRSFSPRQVYRDPNSKELFWQDAANIIFSDVISAYQVEQEYDLSTQDMVEENGYTQEEDSLKYSKYSQKEIHTNKGRLQKRFRRMDRYTKIRSFKYYVLDTSNQEHILEEEQFAEWIQEPAVIVKTANNENIVYGDAAYEIIQMTNELNSNVYHYVEDVEKNITPVAGEEQGLAGEVEQSTTEATAVLIKELIEQQILEVNKVPAVKIRRILIVGQKLVYEGIIPISEYPILVMPNHWNRDPFPQSDIRFVKELQQYVNKLNSLIIAHASNSVNVKWWIPRGSVNKKEMEAGMGRAGTFIGEYEAELGPPIPGNPAPMPNALYTQLAAAKASIQEILGIFPMQQGDVGSAPSTYKGTMLMDEFGQRRIKSKKDDIEAALIHFARVLIEMIQIYYTERKAIRLIQPDSSVQQLVVNQPIFDDITKVVKGKINDVTVGKYDVTVIAGSMLPTNRWAQFDYYSEMYKMGVIDQVEFLKKTEIVDTVGVLERTSTIQRLQAENEQLQLQLKQVAGDKQTTDRENLHLKQKVEVMKTRSELDKVNVTANATAHIFEARLKDQLQTVKTNNKKERK